jgi:hypothetical protein
MLLGILSKIPHFTSKEKIAMPDTSAPCPFVAGPMITDSRLFFGRKDELRALVGKMNGAQPVSVNVVGERRIGKSSLLYHFFRTWEQRVSDPACFVAVYIDLQAKTPPNEAVFYQTLARGLAQQPAVRRVEPLRQLLLAPPRTHQGFADLLEQFADHLLLPVFCLDEFEILLKCGDQFTDSFFDRLRGCMNASQLMFILSSRRPLDVCAGEQNLTSAFFNLGHVLNLGDLTEEEADELVLLPLPDTDWPGSGAADIRICCSWRRPLCLRRGRPGRAQRGLKGSSGRSGAGCNRSVCGNTDSTYLRKSIAYASAGGPPELIGTDQGKPHAICT